MIDWVQKLHCHLIFKLTKFVFSTLSVGLSIHICASSLSFLDPYYIFFCFRKRSFLSLSSLKLSPSMPRRKSVGKCLSSSPRPSLSNTPQTRRKSFLMFLRRSSIFNVNRENTEIEDQATPPSRPPPSFLGQIYKNAKINLSKSFGSMSSFSKVSFTTFSC